MQETLKPEIFWTALAAVGTLLAVLTALFLPAYNEGKRVKKIARLIEGEITRNYQIAKSANSEHSIPFPDGSTQKIVLSALETARRFNIDLWSQYKYRIADDRPESYEKYERICQHIYALTDLDRIPEELRSVKFRGEISAFIKKCREELGLD